MKSSETAATILGTRRDPKFDEALKSPAGHAGPEVVAAKTGPSDSGSGNGVSTAFGAASATAPGSRRP